MLHVEHLSDNERVMNSKNEIKKVSEISDEF